MATVIDAPPDGALGEAKAYLRIETGDGDDVLGTLIVAAIGIAAGFLGRPLIATDVVTADALAGDWPGLPAAVRQGVVRLVAHLHAHRDEADGAGPPAAVTALWRPYRRVRL